MIADLAAQRALDRMKSAGFSGLSEDEKTVAAVWLFESKVANEGFEKFYRGDAGDVAFYAPTAFGRIGANTLASIATDANSVFGPAGPSPDRGKRAAQVQTLQEKAAQPWAALEERFFHCAEETDALLEQYLAAHREVAGHG